MVIQEQIAHLLKTTKPPGWDEEYEAFIATDDDDDTASQCTPRKKPKTPSKRAIYTSPSEIPEKKRRRRSRKKKKGEEQVEFGDGNGNGIGDEDQGTE